ncbi:UbiA-like polyprenyltransferase [Thermodesulforhabdus norvegica]|uniref:4-hydroxybenzoate polyprenyltransferase n=1 Tax=Thermodesulforhabdus norvegica TaxID=39841 RepID=A0A1I4TYD6_9BACT|nr:UbiA-like polyprenyltransferase [Thermodesulforhabdus norvegica]SFM81573.1 4-hydroxybenzoate polyprenyltransferase [Thermodesulforhabdus norvegica]
MNWLKVIYTYGRLIKFSHTIFALPFALSSVILAHRQVPVTKGKLLWIILAMISARSAAMGFNRWADRVYDRMNPRTSGRPSVTGEISAKALITFIAISGIAFVLSARMINPLCFYLAFPVLVFLLSYSYAKRFTRWCHLWLGCAIGLAPMGAWIAVTGDFSWKIVPLSIALMTYIAGFDILYACMDVEFDRRTGIFSLPATSGVDKALWISSLLHTVTFGALLVTGALFSLGFTYYAGVAFIGCLLIVEHRLVSPSDLSRVPVAFFHVNSVISVSLLLSILIDRVVSGS